MEDYTKAQMFDITKEYINEYYQNPLDYISKNYVFYYMSGRFPDAPISVCCSVVEELRKFYFFNDGLMRFNS